MSRSAWWGILAGVLLLTCGGAATRQSGAAADGLGGAALSYEGRLMEAGKPAEGRYDLQLQWFGAPEGDETAGDVEEFRDVMVTAGQFTVPLSRRDAGAAYLEVRVRPGGGAGEWTALRPRQVVPSWSALSEPAAAAAAPGELWRLGFTREGAGGYATLAGRVAAQVAAFRSSPDPGTEDKFFIFPAPATAKSVVSARLHVLSRTGSAPAAADLTLEVYDLAGALQHAAPGTWTALVLSGDAATLAVEPGQFLAFRCRVAAGGDLDIRPMFEVEVR